MTSSNFKDKELEILREAVDKAEERAGKKIAQFILDNRKQMKFRIQHKITAFYTNEDLAKYLITEYWDDWYGVETTNPKYQNLGKNTIGCKRLPHGNFRYQIYLKKDVHRLISDSDRESLWRYLENNSERFNSFVELTNHIKETSGSTELQTDNIAYQNINNNYLNQLA